MEGVKSRLALVHQLGTKKISLQSPVFDQECALLQIRKSLELIAFGSLCSNQEKYAAAHGDFHNEWNAKRLLKRLEQVHPEFYPQPVSMSESARTPGAKHLTPVTDGFLTKDEFVELYDKCSQMIHAHNPFNPEAVVNLRLEYVGMGSTYSHITAASLRAIG